MAKKYFILSKEYFNAFTKCVRIYDDDGNGTETYTINIVDDCLIRTVKIFLVNFPTNVTNDKLIMVDDENISSDQCVLTIHCGILKKDICVSLYDTIKGALSCYYRNEADEKFNYFVFTNEEYNNCVSTSLLYDGSVAYHLSYINKYGYPGAASFTPCNITPFIGYKVIEINKRYLPTDCTLLKFLCVNNSSDNASIMKIGFPTRKEAISVMYDERRNPLSKSYCIKESLSKSWTCPRYLSKTDDEKETKMPKQNAIKNVYFHKNTITVLWEDGTNTMVTCHDENYDAEKGLAMAIAKKFLSLGSSSKSKWYDEFKKYVPKAEKRNEPTHKEKKKLKKAAAKSIDKIMKTAERKAAEEDLNNALTTKPDDYALSSSPLVKKIDQNYVIEMFNAGASISKISKITGISDYFVKKFINEATDPESNNRKAAKILNKAAKSSKKEKKGKPRGRNTKVTFECPSYLEPSVGKRILEETKAKYEGRYTYDSDLMKFYVRECKLEYIKEHYGQGYTMYDIGKTLGISASAVQRIWNSYNAGKE